MTQKSVLFALLMVSALPGALAVPAHAEEGASAPMALGEAPGAATEMVDAAAVAPSNAPEAAGSEAGDYTVLVIDGTPLTRDAIQTQIPAVMEASTGKGWAELPADAKDAVVYGVVQQFLLNREADKKVPDADPEFAAKLAGLKDQVRVALYRDRFLAEHVNEAALRQLYQEKADVHGQATPALHMVQFLAQDEAKAVMVKKALAAGRSIPNVTQAFANRGVLITERQDVTEADVLPAMAKPLFEARPGDVVGPVDSEFGWHVFYIKQRGRAKFEPFESLRPALEQELRARLWQSHVQTLIDGAAVDYTEPAGVARPLPRMP
jgi:peptidyl-prolyl cis-trans isomerase C